MQKNAPPQDSSPALIPVGLVLPQSYTSYGAIGECPLSAQTALTLLANLGAAELLTGAGSVKVGSAAVDQLAILDAVLTAMQAETHNSTVPPNPTSVPLFGGLLGATE